MAGSGLRVPEISQAELNAFHDAHFGQAGMDNFSTNFLPHHEKSHGEQASPLQQDEVYDGCEEQEDDGLGYYEDGVKRTLTDEQISMFRHSELEAMRRAQERGDSELATPDAPKPTSNASQSQSTHAFAQPGQPSSEDDLHSETAKAATKKKKRRRAKARVEAAKPDLRKRTWDVVDSGLTSLDYGDEPQESTTTLRLTQRRHISYED